MVAFSNREDIKRWLNDKPREVAVVIAVRAALRVTPLLARALGARGGGDAAARRSLILPVFRGMSAPWVAAAYPTHGAKIDFSGAVYVAAAAHAVHTLTAFSADASTAAHAAAHVAANVAAAASNAADAADTEPAYAAYAAEAADAAAYAAAYTADAADANVNLDAANAGAIYEAISADAAELDGERLGRHAAFRPVDLAIQALWPTGTPSWVTDHWARLKSALLAEKEDWWVWADWYEARLGGGPIDHGLELARVMISENMWKDGPRAVNAEIGRLIRASRVAKVQQDRVGNRWAQKEDLLVIDPSGDPEDISAARDASVRQLHEGVRRKARTFVKQSDGLEKNLGWEGFEEAAQRFLSTIDVDVSEIPHRIATVYDSAIELGSFLQFDNDLREHPKGNVGRLPPDIRRAFTDLIRTSAPWVRSFPTGRALDEEAGAFLARPDLFEPSTVVMNSARAASLISDHDRALLQSLIAAAERGGFPAEKAGIRGVQSTRNLILAAAAVVSSFYMGAVSSDYSTKSPLVQRAATLIADREKEITQFMSNAPDDIRIAFEEMIKKIKQDRHRNHSPSSDPTGLAQTNRRRNERNGD